MASLGNAALGSAPVTVGGGSANSIPYGGDPLGDAALFEFGGGGTVDPKRYLNVGGTAVPIQ